MRQKVLGANIYETEGLLERNIAHTKTPKSTSIEGSEKPLPSRTTRLILIAFITGNSS